ncbi:MAG: hypothetical protein IGBAC_1349 [Ignavibacteriae bacterium]|nr:MAG: hypothetical protein IGBAC_1349 [Ignavibacteriota bacterium]
MRTYLLLLLLVTSLKAQISQFPYFQNFDSSHITPPALPNGWLSSQNRTPGTNDFTTTTGTSYSTPNCVISTNAKIKQFLISPVFNFSNRIVDSIKFFERRSSTHDSDVLLEASTDGGTIFNIQISDTLKYPGHTNYIQRAFVLPEALNNQSVIFRWNILGNGSGTTATIRFDNITISAKSNQDIGIIEVIQDPLYPAMGDSIFLSILVKNLGHQTINNFNLAFYIDTNYDSIPQTSEFFIRTEFETTLNPGDTLSEKIFIPWLNNSGLQFIIVAELAGDDNLSNNLKTIKINYGVKKYSIVINEIMYRPASPEPEWVELTNTTNDSIDIRDWKISDSKVSSRYLISANNYFIKPKEFIIITKDSTTFLEIRQNVKCKIFNVPNLPALNNDSDAVVIYDNRGGVIDSVFYRYYWGGSSGGKSLERISTEAPSTSKSNWGSSTHPEGCTPGKKNSISQKDFDLKIHNITYDPAFPIIGETLKINIHLKNIGKAKIESFHLLIYYDLNSDSLCTNEEIISEYSLNILLLPDVTTSVITYFLIDSVKEYNFIFKANYPEDEDTLNNIFYSKLISGYPNGTVVINEIMYAPVGGEPEWIELYNNSQYKINLKDWELSNKNSNSKYKITSSNFLFEPFDYVVITKDTSLLFNYRSGNYKSIESNSLPTYFMNNSTDAIVLYDNRNVKIDSMFYVSSWGGVNGKSLERIEAHTNSLDSTNWGSSLDSSGCTPGKQNYITPLEYDLKLVNVFSDSIEYLNEAKIFITVKNAGKNLVNNFVLNLFFDYNKDSIPQTEELIYSQNIICNLNHKDTLNIEYKWQNTGFGKKHIITVIEYPQDMRTKDNIKIFILHMGYPKNCLIINEIMYQPFSGKSEYVELFNRVNFPVELFNWKLHDYSDGDKIKINEFKLENTSLILNPGEYLILAADSSIFQQFTYLQDSIYKVFVFNKSSLSLNNEGDKIIIRDLVENLIDSLFFTPKWHNPEIDDVTGRSLERINPNIESNDSRNWSTSIDHLGGTPGKQNTIYTTVLSKSGELNFSPNPFSPDADGFEDHCIISFKLPATVAQINVKIFDSKGRLIRTLANNEPVASEGQIIWDGMNDEKSKVNMGIYIVLLEAFDVDNQTIHKLKGVVVVGGRL